jgi:hypothetical protein
VVLGTVVLGTVVLGTVVVDGTGGDTEASVMGAAN